MAEPRQKLDDILRQIVKDACGKENVYYQPPANLRMSYPCICYEQSKIQNAAADNRVYLQRIFYQLTVIDSRPDSKITKALMQMAKCHYDRPYKADNLYHDVITIYF